MHAKVDTRYWRFCAWMGPLFVAVFYYCWGVLGHNFPPFSPDAPAAEVAAYFRDNRDSVRLGMVIAMTFAPTYGVWGYAMAKVLEQSVGGAHPASNLMVQLARLGAAWTTITVLIPTSFWLTAAFRMPTRCSRIMRAIRFIGSRRERMAFEIHWIQ